MTDDEAYTDDDREADEWFGRVVVLPFRRGIVHSLLAGNDCQCFSTRQYVVAYESAAARGWHRNFPDKPPPGVRWSPGMAEMHLRSTGLVRELSPGVWVPVEIKRGEQK